jgi:hypothetical protein
MTKSPKKPDAPEGDPKRGDELLKRMLRTKPKQHKELVKESKTKRKTGRGKRR